MSGARPSTARPAVISRTVDIDGRRVAIALEAPLWDAFAEICRRESESPLALLQLLSRHRGTVSLTGAIRLFIARYFRDASQGAAAAPAGFGEAARPRGLSACARRALDACGPRADD